MIKRISDAILPKGSLRRKFIKKVLVKLNIKSHFVAGYYNTWMQQQRRFPTLRDQSIDLSKGPLISIIVPAYNTPEQYLNELVYSIISQAYQKWELILVNASSDDRSKKAINNFANRDNRIKVVCVKNEGISINTNIGIKESSGDYIAFCDHDDVLDLFALYEVVIKIINENAELIYTDEDKISDDGNIYFDPLFKPDWSPDLFTHVNYINHLTVVKRSLLDAVGLLNPKMDGAQDYDLYLRVMDKNPKIVHVPKILYHWRAARNSTAQNFSSKKNITSSAKKALKQHFSRVDLEVEIATRHNKPGFYEIFFENVKKVSIVVMPFASVAVLRLFLEILITKTDYVGVDIEIIVPEGVSLSKESDKLKIKTFKNNNDFLGKAIDGASFDNVVIFNQISLPKNKDWAQKLCGVLYQKHVKTVSPLIMRNDDIIDDCGLVMDSYGNYTTLFRGVDCSEESNTFFGDANWVRNVDAISGSVVAVRKEQFKKFLESYHHQDMYKAIFNFSITKELYNAVYTNILFHSFDNLFPPKGSNTRFFNKNLIIGGDGLAIYSSESSVIGILLDIVEEESSVL